VALEPEILLMDEPTSALDPASTYAIEELISSLKQRLSIVIVTHNMSQAKRISDYTAFMYEGRIIESANSIKLFEKPHNPLTKNYINGNF